MYTYQYGGQNGTTHKLVESKDLVVVRTKEKSLEEMNLSTRSRSFLSNMIPVSAFPEASVKIYRVLDPDRDSPLRRRNEIRKQFPTEDGVRFAGRVLKDPDTGAIKVYTENFFLKFYDHLDLDQCRTLLVEMGLEEKEKLQFAHNAFFVEAVEGTGTQVFELAQEYLQKAEVEFCHPEIVEEKAAKSIHSMQWHLKTTEINGRSIQQHVEVEGAWQHNRGEGITIAIIDDGVDVNHPEFSQAGKIVAPRDTVINRDNGMPKFSMENHGTACAGVACAAGLFGATGVAPEAKLMPIRAAGLGSMSEAKAFHWAADHGADVISCSWGPRDGVWNNPNDPRHTKYYPMPDSSRLAIEYALTHGRNGKGCVIVWAAGNGNEDTKYDGYASYEKVITVSACNDHGKRSVYSDYGAAVWCCFPSNDIHYPLFNHPRPLTPGIWTTDRVGEEGYNPGGLDAPLEFGDEKGDYTPKFGGTSSSCPGVAGIVALMLKANPALSWQQVKTIIRASCDPIDAVEGRYNAEGHSLFYGYGRINARKAVENALKSQEPVDRFDIKGTAFFSKGSRVALREGQLTMDDHRANRFIGLKLHLTPLHLDLDIQYRLFVTKLGATPWMTNGSLAQTPDKRRKVIGFAIKLSGRLAKDYSVVYHAKIKGQEKLAVGRDGSVCGTDARRGKSILEIQIEVVAR